ncbi:winged helix-turn-helix domain-containing protein [Pseudomonas sp. FSL R10-1350]|uniref:winged helix-turn-helix domain-containing protein n=1 Tax=Pseudomonas sp. FSL R10-1350 TaxID=2662197 RepID=UPI002113FA55|nr:winged helix-turn-helix domain-containing protein [Pseudomonas sp. FSL R10-1350]
MAKSNCLYAFGLGDMLFAGYKTGANSPSVFNFAFSKVLIDDINNLISSDALHLTASDLEINQDYNLTEVEAFFFEIHTPDIISENLELIRNIRKKNQTACIFIFVTHTKPYASINHYIAGADYCIKLPSDPSEKKNLLSRTLYDSHWKSPVQLYLDRTRLLLCCPARKLEISFTEMTIIDALINAPEHVLSQDSIAKTLDPNIIFYDPRALEKTISRLRTKIKKTYNLEIIFSVRSYGYRLRRGTIAG